MSIFNYDKLIYENVPMALADKYKSLYPLSSMRLNNLATPLCAHALPTIGIIWPSTSDLITFVLINMRNFEEGKQTYLHRNASRCI